jgi:mRNA interferase RelE/StbE
MIEKALATISIDPFRGKQLSYELAGLRSFRTSEYRIIYRIKERQVLIIVISVGHRKEIYKRLKELLE